MGCSRTGHRIEVSGTKSRPKRRPFGRRDEARRHFKHFLYAPLIIRSREKMDLLDHAAFQKQHNTASALVASPQNTFNTLQNPCNPSVVKNSPSNKLPKLPR